jgi:hypothetical protein
MEPPATRSGLSQDLRKVLVLVRDRRRFIGVAHQVERNVDLKPRGDAMMRVSLTPRVIGGYRILFTSWLCYI